MSAHIHTFLLALAMAVVYWWLHVPWLTPYSLQAFAVAVLLYFIVKRLARAKTWHIAPTAMSLEIVIATFAFLILIGSTGNTTSIFYPLTYIHLFFLVFATHVSTAIVITLMLILFHYGLTPYSWHEEVAALLTIPLMTFFFLFAKHQYQEVQKEKHIIEQEEKALASCEYQAQQQTNFMKNFLKPKLQQLKELSSYVQVNREAIQGQLTLLEIELDKVLRQFK